MNFDIPGFGAIEVHNIVCDYNGTLALDGKLLDGVSDAINELASQVKVHVITADTHGSAHVQLADTLCSMTIIGTEDQRTDKRDFIRSLGSDHTIAIGNGRNDELMLTEAVIGIALPQREGAFTRTMMASDIVCTSIIDALNLFTKPARLTATLRNK